MRVTRLFFVLGLCLLPCLATGSNSVLVESKTVYAGDKTTSIGVYFSNDDWINGAVFPLEIRSVTSQAYIRDSLRMLIQGRLGLWTCDSCGTSIKRFYATRMPPVAYRPWWCPLDASGKVWGTAAATVDFVSPDAMLYAGFGNYDLMPPGSDGSPGAGTPSIVFSFGYSDDPGVFEIDTTCIFQANHLLYADSMVEPITPSFTKGVITIIEPTDTISGHITSNLDVRGNVFLSGDLTVDSGVVLTVRRGSVFRAFADFDDQAGGQDSDRVEIILKGTMLIGSVAGARPEFGSTTGDSGSWYGIRIMPGGRFETGIGAVIEDAVIGVTVAQGALADTLSGLTITDCASAGIHTRSDLVAFSNDTIERVWPGKGIYVDSASPAITNCLIDSCEYGLYTFLSSSRISNSRIDGPGVHGIYVAAGGLYADVDTLRFTKDTVYGYFSTAQMSVGSISQCRVDSCGFISDPGGQRSPYGIKAAFSGAVRMRQSTIRDYATTGFDSFRSGSHLGRTKNENGGIGDPGNNSIYADSTGCGGCALRGAAHVGVGLDSLRADENWWGASPPLASWFSGKVDRTPHLTAPLGKIAPPEIDAPLVAAIPREHSLAQNYPNPFNSATEIEFSLASAERVRVKVYNILGQVVKTLADRDYVEGTHHVTWNGTSEDGETLASGVYLYRIVAGDFTQSKKMVLLK